MSGEEMVEKVHALAENFNKGEFDEDNFTSDVTVDPPDGWPEGEPIQGVDAWRRQVDRLRDSWDEARTEIDDVQVATPNSVVLRMRYVTTGKDSGIPFDTSMGAIYEFEGARVAHMRFFKNPDDAYVAAGLSD